MKIYLRTIIVNSFLILLFAGFSFGQTGSKEIITIGDGTNVSNNTPIYPWYGYSFTQTLYFQSELNVADQRITQIGYQYAGSSSPMEVEIEIWLGHSTLTELTSSVPLTSFTKVYDGEWACSTGDEFSVVDISPWIYNNTDNLIITVIEKKPGWNSSSDAFYSTASPAGQTLSVGYEDDNNPMDPNNLPAGSARFSRPNTRIWTDDIPSGPAVSQITPTTLDFGVTPLVQGNVLNVQVKNTGAEPLEITGFSSSNDQFSLINTSFPFTLNAGASQDVEIQFMPLDTDPQSGTITFLMDAAIAGDRDVQVSGTGILLETLIIGTDTYANSNTPFYPYYGYSFTQTIYLQSELNAGVKMIDKIGYQYSGPSSSLNVDIEVYMGHTTLTSLSESIPVGAFTKVYDGSWECVSEEGFSEIDITPFFYNNSDNLIVTFIEKKPGWNSSSDKFLSTSSGAEIMCVGYENDNTPMDPNNLPTGNPISYRANTKFWLIDPPSGPAISQITPLSLDFEAIQVGFSGTMNVVIENTGADPLEITGADISNGQFSLASTSFPFTLFASASKTMEVTFAPTSEGIHSGVITFLMDAAIAGDREVQLAGEGIPFTSLIIGESTTTYDQTPVNPRRAYSFTQTIYLQEELNFSNKAITKIGYQYAGSNANLAQEIEVWIGHTTESYTPWSLPLTGSVKVYDGPWVCHSGEEWSSFDISQFPYNNTDNLLITVIEKDPSTYSYSDAYYAYSVPTGTSVGAYSSSTPYDPNNLPNAISLSYKANIKLWVDDVATGPAISEITPTTLNFGELEFGQTSTMGVVIKNTGIDPLEITGFSSTNDQFSVINTSFPLTLNSNLQQTIDIKFTPTTTELETGVITFDMDAAIEGDKQVDVSGQMLPIPPVVITEFPWVEGFDGGALPDGWQNVVNEGNGFEFSTTPFSHTFIYYFGDLQRNAQLVTPLLDLNGLNPVTLGINHRIYAYETGWSHKIMISEDGVNWDILAEYTEGFNPDDYQYDEFDITPSKAGEQVYIAFAVDYPFLPEYYEAVWEIESVTVFEPIPVFDVSFAVEDDGGNPLTDAVVTLNGVTNPAGNYVFEEMEAGTYDYTVELDGYLTATGQVEVVDQNVEETIVLSPPVVISEFPWFEGFDGGALPLGWQSVVNEGNGFTFALGPYSHTYIYYFGDLQRNAMLITPLLDLSGMETVTLSIYHRIYAYSTGWHNKILISNDGVNWETVADFTEGFNPDINQYMEFDISPSKAGEQVYLAFEADYPLLPDYYEVVWEIVDIEVYEPIENYAVNFNVENIDGNPLNNAVVTLNGITNDAGNYLFEGLEAGTYDYTIEAEGYINSEGQVVVVDQNVEETVVLTPVVITEFPWFEGFDGGALPYGWQNVINEGNGFTFALNPYSHTYIYYFGDLQRNAMLVTPLLDLSGMETVTLSIYHRIYAYSTGWYNKILISNDGVNWETVAEFTEGFNPDVNQYMEFDITPSKAGEQVYLAFEANYPLLPDYYEAVWEIVDIEVFEPTPVFNVTFAVEDLGGNPLDDAVVTLNGVTNPAGNFLFEELEAGTYDYTVALDGYIAVEGQVEVVDQDVLETVILNTGQYVDLIEGWSLISSYITPNSPSFYQVFSDQVEDETLVILVGNGGLFWPGYNINTLGDWNSHSAYKVKMSSPDLVGVEGSMVEDKTVALQSGANYLPVLTDVPVSAQAIFGQISGDLDYAFDLVDGFIYWPEGEIYSLETLLPGRGYLVGMNAAGTVSYADIDGVSKINTAPNSVYPSYVPDIVKTGSVHLISISHQALANIEAGDFIAAFNNQNLCVGAQQYSGTIENLGLVIYGDDQTTNDYDGMIQGETITLKCIKFQTGEFVELIPEWNTKMPNNSYFVDNGLSGITNFKLGALGVSGANNISLSIYPNPASDQIFVGLQGIEFANIEITDHFGHIVLKERLNGENTVVNVSKLPSGMYFVKVCDNDSIIRIVKLIIE